MFYVFRQLLQVIWSIFFKSKLNKIDDVIEETYFIYPDDIDHFLHVNNGSYALYTEFGRVDWMIRSRHLFKKGVPKMVAGSNVFRYRKSLVWGRYVLRSRMLGIQNRSMYFEQSILFPNSTMIACHSLCKMTLLNKKDDWEDILVDKSILTKKLPDLVDSFHTYEACSKVICSPRSY